MQCNECKTQIVSLKCIRSEEKFSFEYDSFTDLLHKLDEADQVLKKVLESKIDKKGWIKTDYPNIVGYLQEVINKIDILSEEEVEKKYVINSTTVKGEKSITELFNILFKEIESLKKTEQSSLYIR